MSFTNNISDIIKKFENSPKSRKNHFSCDSTQSLKSCYESNNRNNFNNSLNANLYNAAGANRKKKDELNRKKRSAVKMVDSIGDDHNIDAVNNSMEDTDIFDDIESIDDRNIYGYQPLDARDMEPTLKRLRNINIVRYRFSFFQRIVGILLSFPFFASVNGAGLSTLTCAFFLPRFLCENILYPIFRLVLGTLYPAYASYKAVRNKDNKDYVSHRVQFGLIGPPLP